MDADEYVKLSTAEKLDVQLVSNAALVGENMILRAKCAELERDAARWNYALTHSFWCADNPNVQQYHMGGLMITLRINPINRSGFIAAVDAAIKGEG